MRWLVLVSFLFSSLGRSQLYSRADQNLWQLESRIVVKNFQRTYQSALKDFRQWGPAAFALHFEHLNAEEKKWLIRELNKFDVLPDLVLTETSLRFYEDKAMVVELSLEEISRGIFKFPAKTFHYNFRLNMMENHKSWKEKKSTFSLFLEQLFIPKAEAKIGKVAMAGIGAVVGALLASMLFKKSSTTMGAIPEAGGAADGAHAGAAGGGGGGTSTGDPGGTSGGVVPPGAGGAQETAPANGSTIATKANIGVTDFPAPNEDLLKDCPTFVDPVASTPQQIDAITDNYTKEIYQIIRNFKGGGTYNAGVSSSTIDPATVHELASRDYTQKSIPANMCSQTSQLLYLAFLRRRNPQGDLTHLFPKEGNTDGNGPWGYWNANGPGTASYVHQSKTGTNTARPSKAPLGSFLKIFWNHKGGPSLGNETQGKGEGHSVAFLGCEKDAAGNATKLCTWGSHTDRGIGVKCYPKEDLGLLIFSNPNGAIPGAESLKQDPFLVDLHKNTVRGRENVMQRLQPQAI